MNGIWIRSEDGTVLVCARELTLVSEDCWVWILHADAHPVAEYTTKEAAIRQLGDIQRIMTHLNIGVATISSVDSQSRHHWQSIVPNVYDLRERKVKEGDK